MLRLCALAFLPLFASGQDAFPIASVEIRGNVRFQPEAVVRASGLVIGERATPADMEAACNRLVATGMFLSARYRFKPAPGQPAYAVTLDIEEAGDLYDIRINIPGVNEDEAWKWLKANDGLALPEGPTSDAALDYYKAAIERYLKETGRPAGVGPHLRADPDTGRLSAVFQPGVLPVISAIRFEGNAAIPAATLEKAVRTAINSEFTEQDFKQFLDFNVRPIYENAARYKAAFPKLTIDKGTVTVTVDEGPVFVLRSAQVAGDHLPVPPGQLAKLFGIPPGQPAGWLAISTAASEMAAAIRRLGYLDVECTPDRDLDEAAGSIDVYFVITPGKQYVFGELGLGGLDPASDARARSLWRLEKGAPLTLDYVDRYENLLMHDNAVKFSRLRRHIRPRPGTNIADVGFAFER